MPKLHEYRNQRGLYIRTRRGNSMATYQLKPLAIEELRRQGKGDGDCLSTKDLQYLISKELAYTNGTGVGIVDSSISPNRDVANSTKSINDTPGHRPTRVSPKHNADPDQPPDRLFPPSCYADILPVKPQRAEVEEPQSTPGADLLRKYLKSGQTERKRRDALKHKSEDYPTAQSEYIPPESFQDELWPPSDYEPSIFTAELKERFEMLMSRPPKLPPASRNNIYLILSWITYEQLGISLWLWLLMICGILFPALLFCGLLGLPSR